MPSLLTPGALRWCLALVAATSMSLPAATDEFRMAKPAPPIAVLLDKPSVTSPVVLGPTACVWNDAGAGASVWTNPLKWDNCTGGSGPGPGPAGTPGAADSAQINAGTVTLDVGVAVATLILNGGTVIGDQNITVSETFNWTGGTLAASSNAFALIASAATTVTLSGGQKNLDGRTLRLQNTNNFWTTGLIELGNGAVIDIANGAMLEIEPGGATERIYFSGVGATPTVLNAGQIVKKGPGVAGIDRNITYTQTGGLVVEAGEFKLRANGASSGDFSVASGATLELSAGALDLLAGSTITGDGALIFGDDSTDAGIYGVAGCLGTNGPVAIRHASLTVGCTATQTFHELRLDHANALLNGSANFAVAFAMQWPQGTIGGNGAPAATLTLNAAATALWERAGGGAQRVITARDFINEGSLTIDAWESPTVLANNARFINSVGATARFQHASDSVGSITSNGVGVPELINAGTLNIDSRWRIFPKLTNSGTVILSDAVDLYGTYTQIAGTTLVNQPLFLDGGTMTVNAGQLSGSSTITGNVIMLGGELNPFGNPKFPVANLIIDGDYTQGAGASLRIEVDQSGGKVANAQKPQGSGRGSFIHDVLSINGTATLDGTLNIIDLGHPLTDPEFLQFLDANGGVSGTFQTVISPYPGYAVQYAATNVRLGFVPVVDPVVTSVGDPGDGACDVAECTLREAINAANATAAADAITFNIPAAECAGAGSVCVIEPLTPLPTVTSSLAIDGYTQPGASINTRAPSSALGTNAQIKIELDGTTAGGIGLEVRAPGATVVIEGLAIHGFQTGMDIGEDPSLESGVPVNGQTNSVILEGDWDEYVVVLPDGASDLNVGITGSTGDVDLYVRFGAPPSLNVYDCRPYEGTGDESCVFPAPASGAVYIRVYGYEIGPIDYALTASWTGVGAVGSAVTVGGMLLGLHPDGSAATGSQAAGIEITGSTLQLGDGSARRMNVISANTSAGLRLSGANAGNTLTVQGNLIGTGTDGVSARGNGGAGIAAFTMGGIPGVSIGGTTADQANVIGHNAGEGIALTCTGALAGACFDGMTIAGNFIGEGVNGADIGNLAAGIRVNAMPSGTLTVGGTTPAGANVIANNAGAGISNGFDPKGGALGNVSILINRTSNNDGLGVDVFGDGRSPNDLPDADGIQNFPEFSAYTLGAGGSTANLQYAITTAAGDGTFPMRVDFYQGHQDELGAWLGSSSCGGPPPVAARGTACTADLTFTAGTVLTTDDSVVAIATSTAGRSSEASHYGTTTALISDDPDPSAVGSPYTVVASVTSNSVFAPLGALTVDDGNGGSCQITLTMANANSAGGSCQMPSALPVGSRTLSLGYAADQGPFTGSSAAGEHGIFQLLATTTSIVSIIPTTTVVGQPYTVSVNVDSGGEPVIQGSVSVRQLSDGATCVIELGPPADGLSGCQLTSHSAFTTAVRATFSGGSGYAASQSTTLAHVVNRASTAIAISADGPDPSGVNQPITVVVTLEVLPPGAGSPTGTIFVTDGTASCGIGLPDLACTFVPKALGTATLEARYPGDGNFDPSVDTEGHTIAVDGADLSIIKRNGGRLLPGGGATTYTLLVSNAGPQAVVNARVNDILPTQLSNASWTCVASDGASCPASGSGTVDTLVSLASGSSLSFALTATVQLDPEQVVTNRATVAPPANAPDPDLDNNESVDTDPIGVFGDGFESENE